jgi:hypothetical protein
VKHHSANARSKVGATTTRLVWILAERLPEPNGASGRVAVRLTSLFRAISVSTAIVNGSGSPRCDADLERSCTMELWLVTVVVILAMATVGTVVARRGQPQRSLGSLLAGRLVVIVVVTALVAIAKIEVGPLAAAVTGVVGVAVAIVLLVRTGYAGSIFPAR